VGKAVAECLGYTRAANDVVVVRRWRYTVCSAVDVVMSNQVHKNVGKLDFLGCCVKLRNFVERFDVS
jgi:hypothetical protein